MSAGKGATRSAASILAATFGWDIREVSECRYQRYTSPAVYTIGDAYFAVNATKPKHEVADAWAAHSDQFFAEQHGTKVWIAKAQTEAKS